MAHAHAPWPTTHGPWPTAHGLGLMSWPASFDCRRSSPSVSFSQSLIWPLAFGSTAPTATTVPNRPDAPKQMDRWCSIRAGCSVSSTRRGVGWVMMVHHQQRLQMLSSTLTSRRYFPSCCRAAYSSRAAEQLLAAPSTPLPIRPIYPSAPSIHLPDLSICLGTGAVACGMWHPATHR